jgi:hypothetical protein
MTKNIVIGVLAVLTLFFGFSYFKGSPPLGAATGPAHYQTEAFMQGLQIGQRGSVVANLLKGTCSLIAPSFTVAASTTVAMDCAITGVVSGDLVFVQFATSTAAFAGWQVGTASASTTAGYITVGVNNWTGVSGVIPASVASSTKYLIVR